MLLLCKGVHRGPHEAAAGCGCLVSALDAAFALPKQIRDLVMHCFADGRA